MGNRITRTVLFAASALLSMSAFGAGAAKFGTLRNSDWVVTNAWQAVSNKTHDLILEIGHGDSLPPNWINVSNAAMSAVQSLQPATNYTDEVALDFEEGRRTSLYAHDSTFSQIAYMLGDTDVAYTAQDLINESTNAAVAVADTKISTNNSAFVSAVLAVPLVGADPSDLSELAEYGSYGTVGAAILALIAGLAALKRGKLDGAAAYPEWVQGDDYEPPAIVSHKGRLWSCRNYTIAEPGEEPRSDWLEVTIENLKQDALSSAQMAAVNSGATATKVETWDGYAAQIAAKANATDLPYALVTPGEWKFSDGQSHTINGPNIDPDGWFYEDSVTDYYSQFFDTEADALAALSLTFTNGVSIVFIATRASLPGHLLDRANNLIDATTGNVTLTLPQFEEGKVRDLLVACTIGLDGNDEPWSVIFQGQGSEAPEGANEISFKAEGDDAASATFPVPDAAGDWWYSLTERAPHVFVVSLKQLQSVSQPPQAQGGS